MVPVLRNPQQTMQRLRRLFQLIPGIVDLKEGMVKISGMPGAYTALLSQSESLQGKVVSLAHLSSSQVGKRQHVQDPQCGEMIAGLSCLLPSLAQPGDQEGTLTPKRGGPQEGEGDRDHIP